MDTDPPRGLQRYADVLSPETIVQVCRSPGVHTLRLTGARDETTGNIEAEVMFSSSMVQGSGGSPTIQALYILSANYDWTELVLAIGTLPSLKKVTVTLAPPTVDTCYLGQTNMLPSWFSHGIPEAIHSLVGHFSQLTDLTLLGFHAFSEQARHDVLGDLSSPVYVPRLSRLVLSGFAASDISDLWLDRIQTVDVVGLHPRKVPLTEITLILKPCRPDLSIIWPDFDEMNGSSLSVGARWARKKGKIMRKIRIDIVYDIATYRLKQLGNNNFGYTCLVNPFGLSLTSSGELKALVFNHTEPPQCGSDNLPFVPPLTHPGWVSIDNFGE